MNSPPWPKRSAPGPEIAGAAKLRLLGAYQVLSFLQAPFGFVFWTLEQRKARLQDRIANEGREL